MVRETQEEVGLKVVHARYLHSQPWPFPQSLMIGFIATVEDGPLTLEEDEIAEARWLTRAELRDLFDTPDFNLSRRDSISRRIVDDWAAEGG
ncbi:MAG: NAD(+) diphosphatase [Pseudomonadota bacterium]